MLAVVESDKLPSFFYSELGQWQMIAVPITANIAQINIPSVNAAFLVDHKKVI